LDVKFPAMVVEIEHYNDFTHNIIHKNIVFKLYFFLLKCDIKSVK
jgi:hypothetical protein